MKNPLLSEFLTPHQTAPFSKIKVEHFKPAFKQAIRDYKLELKSISDQKQKPTFENTIEALDFSGNLLGRISDIFFNLTNVVSNKNIQDIAKEISPLLSELRNDFLLNEKLFERIKNLYDQRVTLGLTNEQKTLLDKNYKSFIRNGALLNQQDKVKIREIDKQLTKLSLSFGENILLETSNFEMSITDQRDLAGLPDDFKEASALLAKQKGKKGWIVTLDLPSYVSFITYCSKRGLREKIYYAYNSRGFKDNDNNNEEIILKIVTLRKKRTQILGYNSYAQYALENRMALSVENVMNFLNDLLEKSKPKALKEFEELKNLAKLDGISNLEPWDFNYYKEKLKNKLFQLSDNQLKPYFKLDDVLNGAFIISNKLYDLKFELASDIDVYNDSVNAYRVRDKSNKFIAILYTDFFPRSEKRSGAWMTLYKNQWKRNGEISRPHISIVCNFTKPTKTKPSLLTFQEVTTLFHEFGHALHGILSDTNYPSLSGTNVLWDFVEFPSQLFENWCYEKKALNLFAKHYKTGENIPQELIEKIKSSSKFLKGIENIRQIGLSLLDMNWHNEDIDKCKDVKQYEDKSFESTNLFPVNSKNCTSTSFLHIFQGGYSAGYYSYKWAEVLAADAFSYFQENGILNKEIGRKFQETVLSKGGTVEPMKLYEEFIGRKPNNEALLKRLDLLDEVSK